MLRLTVRSGKDGRFLARIVDSGAGHPFVLDFGDKRIIDDVQQRLLHGFTMWRFGKLVSATPQDPDILQFVAEFYAGEGLLVAFEEPTWSGREQLLDERFPAPPTDLGVLGDFRPPEPTREAAPEPPAGPPLLDLPDLADLGDDPSTELVDLEDLTDLGPHLVRGDEDPIEDQQTEIIEPD